MNNGNQIVPGLSLLKLNEPGTRLPLLTLLPINGYACLAKWDTNKVGQGSKVEHITEFKARWEVPPLPHKQSKQTIFLFNGMQPSAGKSNVYSIVQPVLQWGNADAGGGPFWSVVSWYVRASLDSGKPKLDLVVRTKPVPVSPGDILIGLITQRNEPDSEVFIYECGFKDKPATHLTIQSLNQLTDCGLALEAYKLEECEQLPSIDYTSYEEIVLKSAGVRLNPDWTIVNNVDKNQMGCNIRADAIKHEGIQDQVIVYYK